MKISKLVRHQNLLIILQYVYTDLLKITKTVQLLSLFIFLHPSQLPFQFCSVFLRHEGIPPPGRSNYFVFVFFKHYFLSGIIFKIFRVNNIFFYFFNIALFFT